MVGCQAIYRNTSLDESPVIHCGERSAAKDFGRANGGSDQGRLGGRITQLAAVAVAVTVARQSM